MKRLADYLVENGITQVAFARLAGTGQSTVSKWLSGHRQPSLDQLRRIATITGLTLDELAGEPAKPKALQARPRRKNGERASEPRP